MDNLIIQKITVKDITQLQFISKQTFQETFSETNTEENMEKYLEESFAKEKLLVELTNENSAFYLAITGAQIVGYLKLNFGNAQTELKDLDALEVERIYVLQQYHGAKVGQALFDKAVHIAKQKSASYIWLGVWEENKRAINFYRKNGFEDFGKHIFLLGADPQTDILMKRNLINNE